MPDRIIPFAKPLITDFDREAVLQVLRGSELTNGEQVCLFEEEFAAFLGGDVYCVAVSSCWAGMFVALLTMGVGTGDEVICPALTHSSIAHAVDLVGARAIFVDSRLGDGTVDPDKVVEAVTSKTAVISPMHYAGIPCQMNKIKRIAEANGVRILEDAALALGSRWAGCHVGAADCVVFSFYPSKCLGLGEGGMVACRDKVVVDKMRKVRSFGVEQQGWVYDVACPGMNARMTEVIAALGRGQLSRISHTLQCRRENFHKLMLGFAEVPEIQILDGPGNGFYCFTVVLGGTLEKRRNDVVTRLKERGIGVSVFYPHPIPRLKYFSLGEGSYQPEKYPVAEMIADQSISFPVGPHISTTDIEYMVGIFKEITELLRMGSYEK